MESAVCCGLKPSKEKFGCFTVAVNYCEQIVSYGSVTSWQPEKEERPAIRDVLKVRLFSPESKAGSLEGKS
jgi:uncharacterized protein (DUF2461 family)